jgi:hypothetical protein
MRYAAGSAVAPPPPLESSSPEFLPRSGRTIGAIRTTLILTSELISCSQFIGKGCSPSGFSRFHSVHARATWLIGSHLNIIRGPIAQLPSG